VILTGQPGSRNEATALRAGVVNARRFTRGVGPRRCGPRPLRGPRSTKADLFKLATDGKTRDEHEEDTERGGRAFHSPGLSQP